MIRIPSSTLTDIFDISQKIRKIFKEKKLAKRKYAGSVFLKNRELKIFAVENGKPAKAKKGETVFWKHGEYFTSCDQIYIYRASTNHPLSPRNAVERILAHEVAHAIDFKRVVSVNSFDAPTGVCSDEELETYANDPLEFDAEMASMMQIGVPSILAGKQGQACYEALRQAQTTLGIKSILISKPFKTLIFGGFLGHWMGDDKIFKKFLVRIKRAFDENADLIKVRDTERPIMMKCHQKKSRIYSLPLPKARRAAALSFLKK